MITGSVKYVVLALCWATWCMLPVAGAMAQPTVVGGIRGLVYDSARHKVVELAVVSLFSMDSVIRGSTLTGRDGRWYIRAVPAGHYRVLVSAVGFAEGSFEVTVRDGVVDMGVLSVSPRADWLRFVVVTPGKVPMRVRGDTLTYNTGSMPLRVNETVEELLGRLPGLQVDADGTIRYNGEVVQQLLVDGEDIFAQDPSVVAHNFDANRIARVELLDRKSDQAKFSGIDDGSRTKTLNLVLKASSKVGYFGKLEVGNGPGGYYDGNGLLASFEGKEQFTALGLVANTGVTSVGGHSSGEISVLNGNTDPLGASAGKGVPRFEGMAAHYVNAWDGPVNHLLGNYQYTRVFTEPLTTMKTVQALQDSVYSQASSNRSVNRQDQHWGYAIYDYAPDSLSAFDFTFHGSWTDGNNAYLDTASSAWNGMVVNDTHGSIEDEVTRVNVGGSLGWRRRFLGGTLSVVGSCMGINTRTDGYVYAQTRYISGGGLGDSVDQRKEFLDHVLNWGATLGYVRPLWKGAEWGLSNWVQDVSDQAVQGTYDRNEGKYDAYVDSLSSRFSTDALADQGLLTVQGGTARWKYMVAEGIQVYDFRLRSLSADSAFRVRYVNGMPRVQVGYTPDGFTHWGLSYMVSTQMPKAAQLQPVPNNANPLLLALGNPRLRPMVAENADLEWKRVKNWVWGVALQAAVMRGAFSTRTTTDSLGRQVSQAVNVNGWRSAGVNASVEHAVFGWNVGLHTNFSCARTVNYVDTSLNRTDSYTAGGGFIVRQFVPDKYAAQVNTQVTYFDTRNSVNLGAPVRYWTQSHRGSLSLLFIRGWEFRTDAVYNWQGATAGLSGATSVMLWDASVNRNLCGGKLVIRGEVNNVLNEQSGISRSSTGNVNTSSTTNVLGRYWMVGVSWRFDHGQRH